MRIAVISRVFAKSGGGAESYSVALVQQLAARHEIHVFAQESDQPVPGVTYHRIFCLGRKPRWINQLLFAMATWWRTRTGFDVVHSHENTWHGQIQTIHVRPTRYNLFQGRAGLRLVLRWIKVLLSPRLITYVWLEGARFRPEPTRRVVATSDTLKDECEAAYPASRPCMSVVTPGTQLPQGTLTKADARRQLDLPLEVPLLLFVANDYARKGLDTLLQALAKLPADVHLAVAGHPASIPRYRQLAERLGLLGQVHFLGSRNDLNPVYRAADGLVHPTLEDSFAMVVLEAMAHGLPVVVSGPAHCGISRQLQDGVQALLLGNPRDATGLADRINSVLTNTLLAQQLGQHARVFALAHSWESAALQYERLYQQVASSASS
jgi:UDP-glucose:(heptosyl)LPS alpha-1,3-glucosyltransferase